MRFLNRSLFLGGLALATTATAQSSTVQACPSESVSIFETCTCPFGTEFQISTTYAVLGVNAADFSKYTSSCMYQPLSIILFQALAHTDFLVYNIAWQGITNITRNGPDYTVGATRKYSAATTEGTLTFIEKVRPSSSPSMPT
jgi:hypothetical protein